MWVAACGPFLILACAAWLAVVRRAPALGHGRPVFRLAVPEGLACLLINALIIVIQRHAPQYSVAERHQVHRNAQVGWATTYFIAFLYAGIVLHVPFDSPVVFALVIPWVLAAGLLWLWQPGDKPAAETAPIATAPATNRDQDSFWTGLGFYNNPDDPAVMVPKRYGMGFTFNLGNPAGRRLNYMLFGSIVFLVAASIASGHLMRRH